MTRGGLFVRAIGVVLVAGLAATAPGAPAVAGEGLYPDLQTVVPRHLDLVNRHRREVLRFSNGIANRGRGDWRMRPDPPPGTVADVTRAVQEILDADRNVVEERVVSTFEFHPAHNHWHVAQVARYEVRLALDDGRGGGMGPLLVNDRGAVQSVKTTFCLLDWYRIDDNSPTSARTYWDCETSYQGISPGWVDQYHQSIVGQDLDITGAPEGIYYLASTANPEGTFVETDGGNNTAWLSFRLSRDSRGNPKIEPVGHSPCDGPDMCGEQPANR